MQKAMPAADRCELTCCNIFRAWGDTTLERTFQRAFQGPGAADPVSASALAGRRPFNEVPDL